MNFSHAALATAILGGLVAVAQGRPAPALDDQFRIGDVQVLPAPDLAKVQMEDSKLIGGPYRYGVQISVPNMKLGASGFGRWTELDNGQLRWTWNVRSPGAKSLDFHFSSLALPAGASMVIRGEGLDNLRNIDATQVDGGEFFSPYVSGEQALLEITVDAAQAALVELELKAVTHGYRGLFETTDGLEKSGSCNVDVMCSAGDAWQDQIDAVGQYTFSQGGSSYVCTGTLLGNKAGTTTPYFLTANHCVSTATVASSVVVYWNYQSATCRTPGSTASGTPISKTVATHSQSGASLKATSATSDFTLLQLTSAVAAGADVYYSGWDAGTATPSSATGIHHPQGDEKRISVENQALTISGYSGAAGTSHWRVNDWDQGTTEGGSSGSGLWNQNKLLVGQLHGGSAACGNDLSDYYGRLAISWTGGGTAATRLKDWLDPANTAVTTQAGYRSGTTPPPPTGTTLTNGVAATGLGAAAGNSLNYTMVVPSGATGLKFVMAGGTGDADMYVKFGSAPTDTVYDCRPYLPGNAETCNIATAQAGTYYVRLKAYSTFASVSLTGSYTAGGTPQPSFFENQTDYTISDNVTVDSPITVAGRTGNAPSTLKAAVTILHTYQGDLKVDLVAPDGSLYNLHNRTGSGTDNIITTYTVNASTEIANGTWKLRVNDNAAGDTGRIDKWSLQF